MGAQRTICEMWSRSDKCTCHCEGWRGGDAAFCQHSLIACCYWWRWWMWWWYIDGCVCVCLCVCCRCPSSTHFKTRCTTRLNLLTATAMINWQFLTYLCSDFLTFCPFYPRDAILMRYLLLSHVCLSITSWYCFKTTKRRISKTAPHDSPGILVLWCKRSLWNSDEITPNWGAICRCGR